MQPGDVSLKTSVPAPASASFKNDVVQFWKRVLRAPWGLGRVEIYHEIASMLRAGIGIREALAELERRHGTRARRLLAVLAAAVDRGEPLAPAMRARLDLFSPLEAALVAAGEHTGRIDEAFLGAAEQVEADMKIRKKLLMAAAYPVFLFHAALMIPTIGFILVRSGWLAYLTYVIPRVGLLWLLVVAGVTIHGALRCYPGYGRFVLAIPLLGRAAHAAAISRFARALSRLHGAGLTMDVAVTAAAEAAGNGWLRTRLLATVPAIQSGRSLAETVALSGVLPGDLTNLVVTGEQSGDLEHTLEKAAQLYDDRFMRYANVLPGVLFVIGILIIGGMVLLQALDLVSSITGRW